MLLREEKDPITVKSGVRGDWSCVDVVFTEPHRMGWQITRTENETTITIPNTSEWRVGIERGSGRLFVEHDATVITRVALSEMIDMIGQQEAPPVQLPKKGHNPKVDIYFEPL
jgi:hypothetical protein